MASSSQDSTSSSTTPAPHTGCFDPLDLDAFINYDQLRCPSPSLSPSSSRSQLSGRSASAIANPNNTLLPPSTSLGSGSQQTFSGPSHQYDLHKQQTGLPVGAVATTLAVNQASNGLSARNQASFGISGHDGFFGISPEDEFLDFGAAPQDNAVFTSASDMELDFDSPTGDRPAAVFFPESASNEFVNPSSLVGQESVSRPEPSGSNAGRVWPGMHQQQAAKAKAQQQKQQIQQQLPQQRQVAGSSRPAKALMQQPVDPVVEERISRLLNSMRHGSVAGSSEDGSTTHGDNGHAHAARMRKDEEDMDEDERLLASEEGKKLSSKERRQLRNKVSARAFRSRRKEYIGQLEAEIAAKVNEANDVRAENHALREENTRLSDLTRMLLSSPAFSGFLDNLSNSGAAAATAVAEPPVPTAESTSRSEPIRPNTRKDANPRTVAQQQQAQASKQGGTHVGMTFVPDSTVDFSMLDISGSGAWAGNDLGSGLWGSNQPQVFSVTEVPHGPAVDLIDADALSGKSASPVDSLLSALGAKGDFPVIQALPSTTGPIEEKQTFDVPEEAGSNACTQSFDLYLNPPTPAELCSTADKPARSDRVTLPPILTGDKAEHGDILAASKLQRLCASADAACQRLERLTSHL
ncbi:MAG: hypothetical protein M1825_004560 [Sarcosagium campestre]|nr:MAG: hypothetical protein M1825_004560 [Sarcosagium campestre]